MRAVTKMSGIMRAVILGMMLTALPMSASAISIMGNLDFSGNFAPTGGGGLQDATGLSFPGDDIGIDGADGDYALAGITQGDTGAIFAFDFNPLSGGDPLFTIGGFSMSLTEINIDVQTSVVLLLSGMGVMTGPGGETQVVSFFLSANSVGGLNNFSAGVSNVPVPGALLLFGSALAGLGAARRRS